MRPLLIFVCFLMVFLFAPSAAAVPPDPQFSAEMDTYIEAKKLEFLNQIDARGQVVTEADEMAAWCRAVMWWKMANPDGEQRLTLAKLTHLRTLEVHCGQRMRRAPPLPSEPQTPPQTFFILEDQPAILDVNAGETETANNGFRQAHEDYLRWHPEEFETGDSEDDYVNKRLHWWWILGEGARLGALVENPVGVTGPGIDLSEEERDFGAAEYVEESRARAEWRATHPDAVEVDKPTGPPEGYIYDDWRGGLVRDPDYVPRPDLGSDPVEPVNPEQWRQIRQPILVGDNDDVGSGARRREQATGAATGLLRGALGLRGGGSRNRGRDRGPEVSRCRFNSRDMISVANAAGDTALDVLGQRRNDQITIFADIDQSPDSGTFQAVMLQNQHGQLLAPSDVRICDLYGEWRLSVSWTRTTYRNGRQTSRETGGWSETGLFGIPGLGGERGETPVGLWGQLGFSSASHGARQVAMTFDLSEAQLQLDGAILLVHVTRPGDDPVMTTPFALMLDETANGLELAQGP